jgi:pyruvate,water dikinase
VNKINGYNPKTGTYNDSLAGDYLWSSVNFGEAVTETMTPLTWSVIRFTLKDWQFLPGYPTVGNIGGTPYLNISIFATLFKALRRSREDLLKYMEGTLYMELPDEMEIPLIPLSVGQLIGGMLNSARVQNRQRKGLRQLSAYLAETPGWFQTMQTRLKETSSKAALLELWEQEISHHILQGVWCVLGSVTHSSDYAQNLRRDLNQLVGPDDANILIANLSNREDLLASLGLVAGLAKLAGGEISREAYLEKFGHRGPHEFELVVPPPAEDPGWLDEQLMYFRDHPVDIQAMLDDQRANFQAAWERLQHQHPRQVDSIQKRIREHARRARLRELARSEYTRDRWFLRLFALRAAELTGLGEKIFFLTLNEVLALLAGDAAALELIPARKEAYQQYKALPPYPSVIRGYFDPLEWAADPHHRSDIFDAATLYPVETSDIITGSPGSTGQVIGIVRVVASPEQGQQLQQSEILVTVQTDVAWTLLFSRVAAVITDVGAPLSHAAIVARELGIPAVVGCGDATARLKTGDRVKVDGARGTVEILNQN